MNFDDRFGDLLVGLTDKQALDVKEVMAAGYHEGDEITREKVALFVRRVKGEITGEEYIRLSVPEWQPARELANV